jgi:phosphate starvation-inducible PhoH-like protein
LSSHITKRGAEAGGRSILIEFDDNDLLPMLYGEFDRNLARIEQALEVSLSSRGNRIAISGAPSQAAIARDALAALHDRLAGGLTVGLAEVDAAIRLAESAAAAGPDGADGADAGDIAEVSIRTPRRHITPRSAGQKKYIEALFNHELVLGIGPAGTGKTYLAVAVAVTMLTSGAVERIILSRPAVEAGERLGFLPGDMRDKIDPYLRPLYDALYDVLPPDQVIKRLNSGEIEIAPLAFMRGRTLTNAFVILDEGQNTTQVQMKMFLTRLGENSRMVVTGDLSQIDLPAGSVSGLSHAARTIGAIDDVAVVRFTDKDVVRHSLVTRIVRAYEREEKAGASDKDKKADKRDKDKKVGAKSGAKGEGPR